MWSLARVTARVTALPLTPVGRSVLFHVLSLHLVAPQQQVEALNHTEMHCKPRISGQVDACILGKILTLPGVDTRGLEKGHAAILFLC